MQEKAKRQKKIQDVKAASRSNEPRPHSTTSLVLDPNHPLYRFHHEAARYKVAWGGRASAKSWGVAESLIRKTAGSPLTVLCTREYQVSIKDSAHRLLKDTIHRLGLHLWFQVTKDSIKSSCGAEFIFKGLYNNEQGIRSTEGVDICWVEEAQSVREASWRSLLPTIRKPGSEIWITFNLMDETDATYMRFVANPRKNSIVLKLNYDSNPFLPDTMREEMEEDKARDYHMYEHVWLGMPLRVTDAIVLNKKYTVREFADDLWLQSPRLHFGMDFGFSQDPTAVVRFFILENMRDGKSRLYIEYEAYEAGVELDDLGKWMRERIPEVTRWPVKADGARPETISHLRRRDFSISAADKWDGSVKDGIAHLRRFDEIVIHPRCVNAAREARLWRYKTDPKTLDQYGQPLVLPVLIDANNHIWDAVRYGLDGYIQRGNKHGVWSRLAETTH